MLHLLLHLQNVDKVAPVAAELARAYIPGLMVRISISPAAFNAITATLPLGSVGFEAAPDDNGERQIWLDAGVVDRLAAMRDPGKSFSDVILRLVEIEVGQRPERSARPSRDGVKDGDKRPGGRTAKVDGFR